MISTSHTPGCTGLERVSLSARDYNLRLGGDTFSYLQCGTCGLIRLRDVPANLAAYYPTGYYELPDRDRLERLASAASVKLDTVRRFVTSGRLLEIGPAQGIFAFHAARAGFEVDTIEMDERCCEFLRAVAGVRAIHSDAPEYAMRELGNYDVVALWHVIEHLPDPWAVLREAARHFEPGGILVIAAPNPEAWQFRVMGRRWPHLDAPRHLYLLPRSVLVDFLAPLGFELVHQTTRDGDARSWNRFGWQRLLMNAMPGRLLERAAYVATYPVSTLLAPVEQREPRGSAYTLVFRKTT